jgi:hypothetical protein
MKTIASHLFKKFQDVSNRFKLGCRNGFSDNKKYFLQTAVRSFGFVLAAAVLTWTTFTIDHRIRSERSNRTVEICLDFNETVDLCQRNSYRLNDFLERCRAIGVASFSVEEETLASFGDTGKIISFPSPEYYRLRILDMVSPGSMVNENAIAVRDPELAQQIIRQFKVRYGIAISSMIAGKYTVISPVFPTPFRPAYWNESMPLGFSQEKIEFLSNAGFKVILQSRNAGDIRWLSDEIPENVSGLMWANGEVSGYPGNENVLAEKIKEDRIKFVGLEFTSIPGLDRLKRSNPEQMVQGHVIPIRELSQNQSLEIWVSRWKRAVNDRSVRFLFVHFWEHKPLEENIYCLRTLAQNIKRGGYALGAAQPPAYPYDHSFRFSLLVALVAAVLVPLIGLFEACKHQRPVRAYIVANIYSLAGGFLIAALTYNVFLMQKIIDLPGVKITMLLPFILSVFILFSPLQLKKFWDTELKIKYIVTGTAILALVALLFARSGNYSASWLQPEKGLRQWLEQLLVIRPRTKEFLFGQPLLFLGFYFRRPILLWLGILGQISILNTFLHAHTPVMVSLVRSIHGIWIGLLLGYLVVGVIHIVRSGKER